MSRTSTIAALALGSALLVACGRADHGPAREEGATGAAGQAGEQVTATGCLSMNPESRLYVLTTSPDPMAAPVGGLVHTPTTITYQLAGGEGLERHIGHEIEVTGRADQKAAQTAGEAEERTDPARSPAVGGGDQPEVETKTETRIRVVPMQVESFRVVSTACTSEEAVAPQAPEAPRPPAPPQNP